MDNYKIGDEVELLEDFYTRSGAEIIFKKGTIAKVIELQLYDEIHIDVNGDNRWCSPDILKLVDKKDPALISGAEAKLAWANGEALQINKKDTHFGFIDMRNDYSLGVFDNEDYEFRLKPQSIKLNDVEVPAPDTDKMTEDDICWHITGAYECGYANHKFDPDHPYILGVWSTEEKIKQVVAALRSVLRGTNS
ncbi:hypothetical protein [Acinetobacter baumannii]|uniref:hypothetical protein n=1 Tax=Acinetobacter baumannii TaxID=470 RepID=UPI0024DEA7D4|nr:hypothetical protein [Acinetobacter baumannii]MDK2220887.1 hypothetical protein [Acinetobacter baumannii]MDK2231976.1 hypothetical protein [Acinetobacter baumannii]